MFGVELAQASATVAVTPATWSQSMTDFCPGCGVEHHWLACPEVGQSVFPYDPEWEAEEPPPPMVANVPVAPLWDPGRTPRGSTRTESVSRQDRYCLTLPVPKSAD
jgi:hypothetical protein